MPVRLFVLNVCVCEPAVNLTMLCRFSWSKSLDVFSRVTQVLKPECVESRGAKLKEVISKRQLVTWPLLHIKLVMGGFTAWMENVSLSDYTTAILTSLWCLPVVMFSLIFFSTWAFLLPSLSVQVLFVYTICRRWLLMLTLDPMSPCHPTLAITFYIDLLPDLPFGFLCQV